MARTHAQRQKDYIKNKKKNYPKFNEKEAKRREKRKENKLKATEYESMKAKDRMRKQAKTRLNESSTSVLDSSFTSRQSFGKTVARVVRSLPETKAEERNTFTIDRNILSIVQKWCVLKSKK